ncbi:tRNA glutamyl-Q(34) synthetase GluQRS [Enterovirga aerilata]|uniref:tRNA glutamyl-Q(34) synthetase GluQRS n=1 Tax=Enterovirga aerilata TaxID=2730920 RepID=A0A849ICV7_9HYPH|nr:tRNA glutamyl-Q(34) synthetase GluQRS [Enterovirga sp. DB1703]NNM74249.1 tRNA glutamyl-Q(34) synthetase GluQRS [Enterovirga sp. DB1703]
MSPILRFAPSPNGRLHLGHAYSALLNDAVAHRLGGIWLLRIEDIDLVRATPENIAGIEEDLAWLGLSWPQPVRRQSGHMAEYLAGAERLRRAGLLYPCGCSRSEIAATVAAWESKTGGRWPRDPDGTPLYPGTCRNLPRAGRESLLAAGGRVAWRIDMAAASAAAGPVSWRGFDPDGRDWSVAARPERWGDLVLVRKETPTSYNLSVVLDDAAQGVTHVVRGVDLEAATDIHALLGRLFDLPRPLYHHHALLTDEGGRKLSKSRSSVSLAALRAAGESPEDIRRRLGFG